MNAGGAVEQDVVVEQNAAFVGPHESGDGIEHQRLARAAGTEQHGDAGGGLKFQIEREPGGIGARGKCLAEPRLSIIAGPRRLASVRITSATAETTSTSARAVAPFPDSTAS